MKPFNLEAAQRGEPVCAADGREVRLYAFDSPVTDGETPQPILGALQMANKKDVWREAAWCADGRFNHIEESCADLRMAPRKEVRWIVTWKTCCSDALLSLAFHSREKAERSAARLKEDSDRYSISINAIEVEI